jgi:hypothetical protein
MIWPGELNAPPIPSDLSGGLSALIPPPARAGDAGAALSRTANAPPASPTIFIPAEPIVPPVLSDDVEVASPGPPEKGPSAVRGARLVGTLGVFALPPGRSTVGRSPNAGVRIDRRDVSRIHAVIVVGATTVTVEDQNSANGTTVNGAAVKGLQAVGHGDRVAFGSYEFQVELLISGES